MAVPLIALEIVLGFAVPIGWGVWELLSLRRERKRDAEKARLLAKSNPIGSNSAQGSARAPPS